MVHARATVHNVVGATTKSLKTHSRKMNVVFENYTRETWTYLCHVPQDGIELEDDSVSSSDIEDENDFDEEDEEEEYDDEDVDEEEDGQPQRIQKPVKRAARNNQQQAPVMMVPAGGSSTFGPGGFGLAAATPQRSVTHVLPASSMSESLCARVCMWVRCGGRRVM